MTCSATRLEGASRVRATERLERAFADAFGRADLLRAAGWTDAGPDTLVGPQRRHTIYLEPAEPLNLLDEPHAVVIYAEDGEVVRERVSALDVWLRTGRTVDDAVRALLALHDTREALEVAYPLTPDDVLAAH